MYGRKEKGVERKFEIKAGKRNKEGKRRHGQHAKQLLKAMRVPLFFFALLSTLTLMMRLTHPPFHDLWCKCNPRGVRASFLWYQMRATL